jgi:hypothetical protein
MSIEKDDFKFPDEAESPEIEVVRDSAEEEIEIEVVDDTPPEDKNKKPKAPPEDITEDELKDYSTKVRKRLEHFSRGYHDERRAKEQAQKEREELERVAKQLIEENKKLKGTVNKNQEVLLEQAKKQVEQELGAAKNNYKRAYESGDADALVSAQEELTAIKLKAERVNNFKLTPLQEEQNEVQTENTAPESRVDPKAKAWAESNPWFGSDDEMTSYALGLHSKLVKQGVDPRSDEYYETLNSRMRQIFPENFSGADDESRSRKKPNVVAAATRSTAPKKVRLTDRQVATAKKLGVPLELYAKHFAEEVRKQNG